ncbi:hypothetical protein [Burkholderia sp. Bp9031]|uniref:hypothetical protein n=1 Tax=Burkholderia sp. Bp9031 TaxID=2184566 RepID=UPI000F5EF445|nr:hypothetical protein [Burkholderia sp. Bp9031]
MMSIEPAAGIGGIAGGDAVRVGAAPSSESICSVRIGRGTEENRFRQYCILNRARMSMNPESRGHQDFAAAQQAELRIRTA